jgi:hypothetical protein
MSSAEIDNTKPQLNPVVHVIAPLVAYGATMLVRKVLQTGYRKLTGDEVPDARDPQVRILGLDSYHCVYLSRGRGRGLSIRE